MDRCITQLKRRLTLDTFAETAMLADKVNDTGLYETCKNSRSKKRTGEVAAFAPMRRLSGLPLLCLNCCR